MPRNQKNMLMVAAIAMLVSAGVVWASNNVQPVHQAIGR